jgi:hypothetical protein
MNPLQSFAAQKRHVNVAPEAQAVFFRRRHQPRRPPPAKIKPGRERSVDAITAPNAKAC